MVKALRFCSIALAAAFVFVSSQLPVSARVHNDYIVVLDTSYSMSGKGGRNIFDEVRKSLNVYVDKIQKGDSLTFITFDSVVKLYPTVNVESDNSRDIVKKYLSVLEAKGEWTYTVEMLRTVLKTASDLRAKDESRQQVIVIMTDAQDDPPPAKRGDKIDLRALAKATQGNEWFIYLIDTGELDKNPKLQKLKSELSAVSKYTQVVDTKQNIQKAVETMTADAEKKSAEIHRPFFLNPFFLAAVVLAVLLLVIWYVRRLSRIKLDGVLEYWCDDTFHKDVTTIDLSKFDLRRLGIGRGDANVMVRLRDFSSRKPLILEAVSMGGKVFPVVAEALSSAVEYVGEKGAHLAEGSTFKAGGYTFVFHEKKK